MQPRPPTPALFPYPPLFRSVAIAAGRTTLAYRAVRYRSVGADLIPRRVTAERRRGADLAVVDLVDATTSTDTCSLPLPAALPICCHRRRSDHLGIPRSSPRQRRRRSDPTPCHSRTETRRRSGRRRPSRCNHVHRHLLSSPTRRSSDLLPSPQVGPPWHTAQFATAASAQI